MTLCWLINTEVINEDDNNPDNVYEEFLEDLLNIKSVPFQCVRCLEEFVREHVYTHVLASSESEPVIEMIKDELDKQSAVSNNKTNAKSNRLTNWEVKLYDVYENLTEVVPRRDSSITQTRQSIRSHDSRNIVPEGISYQATNQNEFFSSQYYTVPVADVDKVNVPSALRSEKECLQNDIRKRFNYLAEVSFD